MKQFIFAIILFPSICFSQIDSLPRNEKGTIEYSSVVEVPNIDAKVLYSRAKLFMANAFVSSNDVTQLNDDEAKSIVGKGNFKVVLKEPMIGTYEFGHVKFSVNIQAKDNKYRYIISDFIHVDHQKNSGSGGSLENEKPACGTMLMSKKRWARLKGYSHSRTQKLISQLDDFMKGETKESSDNW